MPSQRRQAGLLRMAVWQVPVVRTCFVPSGCVGVHGVVVVSLGLPVTHADGLREFCEVRLMVQSGEGKGRGGGGSCSQEPGSLGPWPAFLFTARGRPGRTFLHGL
ncbi:unnamed protein product [Rangifer tarandus platyrhynchus]|uniref:Uncharacterized protein n=1 Tax=Rangifer tarandus platyrhynchus TaxID=3082113 RepID=A0AC59YYT2_RANTA